MMMVGISRDRRQGCMLGMPTMNTIGKWRSVAVMMMPSGWRRERADVPEEQGALSAADKAPFSGRRVTASQR
jgi:hypothetical protein